MTNPIDETHDYVEELEEENKTLQEYIENQGKKRGELERNLKSLRELQELEVGEWEEWEERLRKIVEDIPLPPGRFTIVNALNEWVEKYTTWHKRMMEHLSNGQI